MWGIHELIVKSKLNFETGKNFLTNPTKKGSGYGYTSLTIGKDFEYTSEYIGRPDEMRSLERQVSQLNRECSRDTSILWTFSN